MHNTTTRRELLLVASLGGVAAIAGMTGASAQDSTPFGLDAKRTFHTHQLVDSLNAHDGIGALSRDGVNRSLARLVDRGIINRVEANSLTQLVSSLFENNNLDQLVEDVQRIVDKSVTILGETAESIAAVMQSSIEVAVQRLNDVDYQIVQTAIAHDVKGALEGATAGAVLGSTIPALGLSATAGAAIGAILGGTASSIIGYSE